MSACITCKNVKTLAKCGGVIIIGTITDANTDVFIYVQEISTGRIDQYDATSDNAGLVAYNFSDKTFNENSSYEIWITPNELYSSLEDKLTFTIDGSSDTYECIFVEFEAIQGTINGQTIQA